MRKITCHSGLKKDKAKVFEDQRKLKDFKHENKLQLT